MVKPMQPVFYLDLDRTLFRTDKAAEIFAMIEQLYPDNYHARHGYAKRAEHYVYPQKSIGDETSYYHDVAQWLRDVGIDENEAFARLAVSDLADGRFEYPGVAELITQLQHYGEVKILTYGEDTYQRFKARLCPSLKGIEVVTTTQQKSVYLNAHGRPGDWIVDDKVIEGINPLTHTVCVVQEREVADTLHSLGEVAHLVAETIAKNTTT